MSGVIATADNFGESFILEIVGLAIVVAIVVRYVVPWLGTQIAAKREEISTQLSAGDEARKAAAELLESRKAALASAGDEAKAIVEQARRGAELVASESVRLAEEEYERIVRRAAAAIDAARGSVCAEIMAQVGRLVLSAATDVVEAELDAPAQHRLIGEAITATEAEVH